MENYFAAAKIPDAEKVMITTMYLAKDVTTLDIEKKRTRFSKHR